MSESFENKLVMVCKQCKTAACWYGEFMCDEARNADTCLKPVFELRDLSLESPYNWSDERMEMIYGDRAPFGYAEKIICFGNKPESESWVRKMMDPKETGRWTCPNHPDYCCACQMAQPKADDLTAKKKPEDWRWPQDWECAFGHEGFPRTDECGDFVKG